MIAVLLFAALSDYATVAVSADFVRSVSAALSVLALFVLGVAVVRHPPGAGWRALVWAFVAHQGVIAYALVDRAQNTPPGLPDQRADLALVLIVLSTLSIAVAAVGVFIAHRHDPPSPRG